MAIIERLGIGSMFGNRRADATTPSTTNGHVVEATNPAIAQEAEKPKADVPNRGTVFTAQETDAINRGARLNAAKRPTGGFAERAMSRR